MQSLGSTVIAELRLAGCRALSGLPGGGSNGDLVEEAARQGLRFVLTTGESGGGIIAATLGELTGSPGACLATLGPGAASLVNSIAHAKLDRCPVIALTDDLEAEDARRFEHQVIDQAGMLGPLVKQSIRLTTGTPAEIVRLGIAFATTGVPGPVHFGSSAKALKAAAGDASAAPSGPAFDIREPSLAGLDVLRRAKYPVALIGLGARHPADTTTIRRLCRAKNIPVLATYKGKGIYPDTDDLAAGVLTNGRIEGALMERADAFIAIGLDPVELLPRAWPYAQPVVYVGNYSVPVHQVPLVDQWIGDISAILARVEGEMPEAAWRAADIDTLIGKPRRDIWDAWPGFSPADIVRTVNEAVPQAWVSVDAGAHMFAATELWPSTRPNQLLISNGLATMGFALPAAIAASIAHPDDRVIAFTGDGGLLIALGEMRTAVREKSRLIIIVFNDESLSLIRIKQELMKRETRGVALGETRWAAVAEGMGMPGFMCNSKKDLERCIVAALDVDGPSLIDCRFDGAGYADVISRIR